MRAETVITCGVSMPKARQKMLSDDDAYDSKHIKVTHVLEYLRYVKFTFPNI